MDIEQTPDLSHLINDPNLDPQQLGAQFWYELFLKQRAENQRQQQDSQQQQQDIQQVHHQLSQLQAEVDQLKEALRKLSHRTSDNSSQPPSSDGYKKKSQDIKRPKRKQG